ncbi:MAG: M23 family metallopeptidase [Clostridia bacterium]|nr:M23 family metallopeptidase [Clostridia bacterium]
MSKIQQQVTMEKTRKNTIRNATYALLVAFTIILSATLIAINTNSKSSTSNNATIAVGTNPTTFIAPMENATLVKDFSNKELQYNDTLKQWEIHKALDIISDSSNNVISIAKGTVTNVYTNYLEGGVIEITHDNGIKSVYKSLEDISVKNGDYVNAGDVIASVSSSMARELNTGNHLHFEIFENNISIDPNNYIDFSNK